MKRRAAALSSSRPMATATYVYCVVQSARKPPAGRVPAGLPGGETPRLAEVDSRMWVVHAPVPLARYGTQALEESLRDLEWVSKIAVAHEAVVEHFAGRRGVTVIPMKLFTLFSSPARAIAEMRRRSQRLASLFAKLQGCEEWGVRIMRGSTRSAVKGDGKPATGAAFLAARKRARDESLAALRDSAQAADDAYALLAEIAADHRRRQQEASGVIPPLLDAAFLVPVRRRARFRAVAERAAEDVLQRGGRLTLTGPWPAYNFVSVAEKQA
jgi:Gas vesicle synthesis protein GvpL/GvpF